MEIAVLITCFNRREKTLTCLKSLFDADIPENCNIQVFLVDDNSQDETAEAVKKKYPNINVLKGNGQLYWSGGMIMAWEEALSQSNYDSYILLNDDVELKRDFLMKLINTEKYSIDKKGNKGIYSSSTMDPISKNITYGGSVIAKRFFLSVKIEQIEPFKIPRECDLTNANILMVSNEVVQSVGIFDDRYVHGFADYDYSLRVTKNDFPVWITPGIGGYCENDHGVNWKPQSSPLRERIKYLRSPKGLAYKEYLYYIWQHFPITYPYAFLMVWLKTLFPIIWDKYKRD